MRRTLFALLALLALLAPPLAAYAAGPEVTYTDPGATLVQDLVARYDAYAMAEKSAARDLEAYRATRTAAQNRAMEARLTAAGRLAEWGPMIQSMSAATPDLAAWQFLVADQAGDRARTAYYGGPETGDTGQASLLVITFAREEGLWRVGDVGRAYLDAPLGPAALGQCMDGLIASYFPEFWMPRLSYP